MVEAGLASRSRYLLLIFNKCFGFAPSGGKSREAAIQLKWSRGHLYFWSGCHHLPQCYLLLNLEQGSGITSETESPLVRLCTPSWWKIGS